MAFFCLFIHFQNLTLPSRVALHFFIFRCKLLFLAQTSPLILEKESIFRAVPQRYTCPLLFSCFTIRPLTPRVQCLSGLITSSQSSRCKPSCRNPNCHLFQWALRVFPNTFIKSFYKPPQKRLYVLLASTTAPLTSTVTELHRMPYNALYGHCMAVDWNWDLYWYRYYYCRYTVKTKR